MVEKLTKFGVFKRHNTAVLRLSRSELPASPLLVLIGHRGLTSTGAGVDWP
jgi:hypothetical protein